MGKTFRESMNMLENSAAIPPTVKARIWFIVVALDPLTAPDIRAQPCKSNHVLHVQACTVALPGKTTADMKHNI